MKSPVLVASAAFLIVSPAFAIGHNESVDGDLSDDRFNPDTFLLDPGSNLFVMSVVLSDDAVAGDRDYFTVTVPAGFVLEDITLDSLSATGNDDVAFIGVQEGMTVDVDPQIPDPTPLLGFTLTTQGAVGQDLIPGLTGGLLTLPAGDYAFWVQQTGSDETTLGLDFNVVVPAPGTATLVGAAALVAVRRRRR